MGSGDQATDHPRRVLVVEDSRINRIVVMQMLKRAGLAGTETVRAGIVGREAESARQAIEMLQAEPFDLVLMDIQMPGMDGLEATRAIRAGEASDRNRDIPIIAMTAYATSEDEEACYEAGATGYLAKPLSLQRFITAIQSALED